MRTTLMLNDDLLAEAKKRAADRGQSLSAVVNDALRASLQRMPAEGSARSFSMPTYRPARRPARDTQPDELKERLAAEERAPYRP